MKVYVDKMPKNCDKCEIYKLKLGCCNTEFLNTNGKNERHSNCPLQLLQNHDEEVRKQFSNKLKKRINQCHKAGFYYGDDICLVINAIEKSLKKP